MSNTNGYGMKKAILYARASTEEQARRGYPLAQQLEALREYAARKGYEVIAEVTDAGWSGSSIDRPGMNRAWGTAAQEDVFAVLAVSRDRFSRNIAELFLKLLEFGKHGCRLIGLDEEEARDA